MTTPYGSGTLTGTENPQFLNILLQKYGNVTKIPANLLAQAGYTPTTAAITISTAQQGLTQNLAKFGINPADSGPAKPSGGGLGGWVPNLPYSAAQAAPGAGSNLAGDQTIGKVFTPKGGFTPAPAGNAEGGIRQSPMDAVNQALSGLFPNYPSSASNARTYDAARTQLEGHAPLAPPSIPQANVGNGFEGGPGAAGGSSQGGGGTGGYGPANYPTAPGPASFSVKDFSDKANQMAAAAYAPQYAALDSETKQNKADYDFASQIVGGLYKQLGVDIGNNTNTLNSGYDAATQNAQTNSTDTQAAIGDTYQQSESQVADLLKQLGAPSSAGQQLLQPQAADQAYAQSQAIKSGEDQTNNLAAQKAAAQTYQTGLSQANATQGTVAQQDLLQQLSDANSGVSQQRLNLAGNQSQQALGLGQDLSNQDLQVQQLQYGAGQDRFNDQLGLANAANSNYQWGQQFGASQQQNTIANQLAQQQLAAQLAQQQYDNQYGQYKDGVAQQQFNQQFGLSQQQLALQGQQANNTNTTNEGQLALSAQELADKEKAAGAPQPFTDPVGQVINQITPWVGNATVAQQYVAVAQYVAQQGHNGQPFSDPRQFALDVANAATAAGLDPTIAQTAANAYYASPLAAGFAGANTGKG